jgi:hypothetical protein
VGGPSPQHLPEALDDLELWAIAGQAREFQMSARCERLSNEGSPMPGSVVDGEHYTRILGCGMRAGDIAQVPRKARLQAPLSRFGLLRLRWGPGPLHQARRQPAGHAIERTKDVPQIVASQVAHHRPVPFEPQSRAQQGDHREARVILTQQDKFPGLGLVLRAWRSWRATACCAGLAWSSPEVGR